MSENQEQSEMDAYYERTRRPLFRNPTTRLGKLGCGLAVVLWFCFLMLPCAMFWLASGRSITIPRYGVPQAQDYPHFQMTLIMTQENRGFQLTNTSIQRNSSDNLCVEANVTYLLWASEDNQNNAIFCDCYQRSNNESDWVLSETQSTFCER